MVNEEYSITFSKQIDFENFVSGITLETEEYKCWIQVIDTGEEEYILSVLAKSKLHIEGFVFNVQHHLDCIDKEATIVKTRPATKV